MIYVIKEHVDGNLTSESMIGENVVAALSMFGACWITLVCKI
jgi:hypothetical protein